jgi:GR25 family glycosyltransferase involved in LPS biosynthesis
MTILISIDRAKERKKRIYQQGIKARLLENSVDGLLLDNPKSYLSPRAFYDFDKKKNDHRTITSIGAIGCYMSHENAWNEVINNNKPELIIEDDITVIDPNYINIVNEWISSDHKKPRIKWLSYGYLNKEDNLFWGTGAYIINPLAAKILLDNSRPIEIQVDSYMHLSIKKYNWDLELSKNVLFIQYETNNGPFKTLCQEDNKNCSINKYIY